MRMQILPTMDLLALHSDPVWTAPVTCSLPERAGVSLLRDGESLRMNAGLAKELPEVMSNPASGTWLAKLLGLRFLRSWR
jgi:hypothetical protein